jgi:hypothetical protein
LVDPFASAVAGRLAELPGVLAVSLGGSRAQGANRPDSDWDFAIYYRGEFDPQTLRDVGWPGEVFEIGGWGGGVFNGGAWLTVEGRQTDVHYRDLNSIDEELVEAARGRFRIEPLMFHLAGIPSYLVLAELALSQTLRGELPRPDYPQKLREQAPGVWWKRAFVTFDYARNYHAAQGRLTLCTGLLATAVAQAAHAVLAGQGIWTTNEKTLLAKAGLEGADRFLAEARPEPELLRRAVDQTKALCAEAVRTATSLPDCR